MLKKPIVVVILGFLLLAVVIWMGGEYLGLADETRVLLFAAIVLIYVAFVIVKGVLSQLAGKKLAEAVVKQGQGDKPSADVVQLRERFEEAIAALKQKKRGGHSLYDLPWYVIIGAPGSGKTTALVNSGLHFPLEQRTGKGALRGVGGTRNCDWWFTEEAVLLDTAGRYTTQDSDAAADSAGWAEFLGLLKKYRTRRPLNGVILAISAHDLIVQGQAGREAHVAAARRRLNELNKELKINLPVYVLVTKCDLVSGFTEYFDDITKEGRAQVWGVTFSQQLTDSGGAAAAYPEEFDALIQRLNERVFARLEDDHDVRRRAKVFGFPQQMAALRESLTGFIGDVFESTRFDKRVLLRGVYFTSGTQEGTPIDRLLGAIGRRFAAPAEAVPPGSRGRAYFIESLLKDVMLAESGLAGVNRRLEIRKAAAQFGLYVAMIGIAVLGVLALTISYRRNASYLETLDQHVAHWADVRQQTAVAAGAPGVITRLNAGADVVAVVDRHRADTSWLMRWGLYQSSVGGEVHEAYGRELRALLLPQVVNGFEQRLNDTREPEAIYGYLKGYLMLGRRGPAGSFDPEFLSGLPWTSPEDAAAASKHFKNLLADPARLEQVPPCNPSAKVSPCIDERLVSSARGSIQQVSLPALMVMRLVSAYASDTDRALHFDAEIKGGDQTLRFKSRAFTDPVPSLYTKAVFEEVTTDNAVDQMVDAIKKESWVSGAAPEESRTLRPDYRNAYENAYIKQWQDILDQLDIVPMRAVDQMVATIGNLASKTSPLKRFLKVVDANTYLIKAAGSGPPPVASRIQNAARGAMNSVLGTSTAPALPPAGGLVTQHFDGLHRSVNGEDGNAPIDLFIKSLQGVQAQLGALGPGIGSQPVAQVIQKPEVAASLRVMKDEAAALPNPLPDVVKRIGEQYEGAVILGASSDLEGHYRQEVASACSQYGVDGYPFGKGKDITLRDFGDLFGSDGVFDRFFNQQLSRWVDDSKRPWQAKTGDATHAAVAPAWMIDQFMRARDIRDAFFENGGKNPKFGFTLTPINLDELTLSFVMSIDGQQLMYRNEAPRPFKMTWPGTTPGDVSMRFEDRSPVPPSVQITGPWALFRLLDSGQLTADGDMDFILRVGAGSRWARLRLTPDSRRNPIKYQDYRQFACR